LHRCNDINIYQRNKGQERL